jgi:hypothetical protein
MDLDQAYRWLCGDFEGRDDRRIEQNEERPTMSVKPVTIDDIIERLTKLKDEFGNLEVRRFEGRYRQEPNFDTYPTFSILPADRGNQKIVVVL